MPHRTCCTGGWAGMMSYSPKPLAIVDGTAHFITGDALEAVAELILEHFVAVEVAA